VPRIRTAAAVALVALLALAIVAGCGGGDGDSAHNAQDVSFAKDMVPHHQQAVMMADMALTQSTSPQLKDLASRIKASQTAEISTMSGWLAEWGEEATDHSSHSMDSSEGMKGMVSDPDMSAMGTARGPDFDRLFVKHMTAHHEGAVEMAKTQLEKGRYEPAKALARDITAAQQKEIAEMAKLPTS
jgi:uncharacterized protein (DUF305 family)